MLPVSTKHLLPLLYMPNVGSGSSVVQEEEEEEEELSAAFGADLKHVFALRIHAMSDDWRSWLELRFCLFRSCLWHKASGLFL